MKYKIKMVETAGGKTYDALVYKGLFSGWKYLDKYGEERITEQRMAEERYAVEAVKTHWKKNADPVVTYRDVTKLDLMP